jgi:4-amino-4-deoxy-L-arabinose transferase-like glycosyltransferase
MPGYSALRQVAEGELSLAHRKWLALSFILALATVLRLLFFNGFFGSDDLVYLSRSNEIASGVWSSANYNGALRYGYNIPAAFFIWLFGLSMFTANLWALLCSLGEVAIVYWFACRFLNAKIAFYAGLIMATVPLHIALATRIHADPVLSCFLTMSFVLMYAAEQSQRKATFFAAGLAMGMVFWVKELATVALLAFISYPLLARHFNRNWLWVIAGGFLALLGHLILMQVIAGNPLHLIQTVLNQVQTSFIQGGSGQDGLGYYFRYLFADIKHTWLTAYLAVAGLVALLWSMRDLPEPTLSSLSYSTWWLVSLLLVLTALPVSLDPLRFVMKQSNYLNLFIAPMAILSGFALTRLRARVVKTGLLLTVVTGGIALGALEQAAYRVFTANSKAAVEFARVHPDDWVLGSINNGNMAGIRAILDREPALADRFGYLDKDRSNLQQAVLAAHDSPKGFVVVDQENQDWGTGALAIDSPPSCWAAVQTLEPANLGTSHVIVDVVLRLVGALPPAIAATLMPSLEALAKPAAATVYRVDAKDLWCNGTGG